MKKLTAMILAFSLAISMIPQMPVKADEVISETEVIRYNESGQNYTTRASTVDSYLTECSDGNLMRVQYISAETGIIVEYYNDAYELLSSKTVKGELPIFGGFYETDTNYYLVTGQTNHEESDSTEVFRITKYDKDWNRIAAAGVFGANTTIPFDAGSVRMDSYKNYLLIRTCHEMYTSPKDGLNHQANVMIQVNTDTMTVTQYDADVSNISTGYVSHSFNQFIQIDSGKVVSVDHGDAYPRSIVLCKYPTDVSTGKYRSGMVSDVTVMTIPGQIGVNSTGASVGGFEISDSSYLVAGNSVIQDNQNLSRSTRNIFLASVPKNSNSVTLNWLTYYEEGEEGVSTPHMIKIRDDLYMLLWERDGNVYYKACDGQGNPGTRTYTMMDAVLSECVPLVTDTKVIWYSCDSNNMVFYDIDLEGFGIECGNGTHMPVRIETKEPTCTESGYQAHWECKNCGVKFTDESGSEIVFDETYYIEPKGHDYISQSIDENGISHLKCSACGHEKEAATITSVKCWWKEDDNTSNTYYSNFNRTQTVGAELECWVQYEPKNTEDKLRITSSDENIISEEELKEYSGNKFVNLIMKKAGEATITISSLYNPELKEEYKITVECGENHVWNSDFTEDKEATCIESGSKSIHCANCNQVKDVTEIPALGHDMVHTAKKEATCTEKGILENWKCNRCKKIFADRDGNTEIKTTEIPELGHDLSSEIFSDSVSHWHECIRCFAPIDKEMHKGGNADCENPGKCVVCENEYLEAKGHEWEADFTVDKEAACTEKGSKSIHCANCEKVKDVTEIPALGHDMIHTPGKAATCTEKGILENWKCNRCKKIFADRDGNTEIKTTEIPELGHDLSSEIFSDSVSHWHECNRCSAPIDKEMHKGGNVDCGNPGKCVVCGKEYLEAKGHEWEADFTVDKEATCTESGSKSIHCANCNQVKDVTEIPVLGHDMVHTAGKKATCTEKGILENWKCNRCKKLFADRNGNTEIKTVEIPALGHNFNEQFSFDAEKHWQNCERCGVKRNEALHTGGAATTTEQARCTVCGTAYGELIQKTSVADIFVDVKEEDWYKDAVQFVYDESIMTGMNDTYFGSVNNLARAQFAMVIYRMEGAPEIEFRNIFPDVKETDWFADAVIWAYENGIITGYTDTKTFGPSDNITREQMATMMHRYAVHKKYDVSGTKDLSDFPDNTAVSAFAQDAMQWCAGAGIITGDGVTGKLLPQGNTNRVVCATIMQRFIQQYEK